ncbi:uncharacterized protein LOC129774406 [Toxorhynchites rutilus septentrionalis]|uniref:uncharacterized protein LOC129774406 n=1 Tax=Toxorhynchites rutilus septentrionalis TaxID=329112 RepID=UPI00247AD910|nr:uncharacterized protein LOC129774406 [Toxorhynchites rutilus septentrionalis]
MMITAFREMKLLEMNSDTEEHDTMTKMRKVSTAADLFKHIQQSNAGPSRESAVSILGVQIAESPSSESINESQGDLECNSLSQLKMSGSDKNRFPASGQNPSLNMLNSDDDFTEKPDLLRFMQSLHEKTDKHTRMIEECKLVGNRSVALLSQVNAKLDILANQVNMKLDAFGSHHSHQTEPMCIETRNVPLSPIKSFEEFESVEKKANKQFIDAVVQYFGSMHGKNRYVGEGGTVCLQIVDYFFDREFLLNCSWTGTRRRLDKSNDLMNASKIPFHKFDGVINLFHRVVMFSDPLYPLVECQNFLKRCLRNAQQRFREIKGIRAPVARRKRKRNTNQSVLFSMADEKEHQNNENNEEEEQLLKYEGPDEMDITQSETVIVIFLNDSLCIINLLSPYYHGYQMQKPMLLYIDTF